MYTKELLDKLDELRKLPSETEWLEFKEAKINFDFDNLVDHNIRLCILGLLESPVVERSQVGPY